MLIQSHLQFIWLSQEWLCLCFLRYILLYLDAKSSNHYNSAALFSVTHCTRISESPWGGGWEQTRRPTENPLSLHTSWFSVSDANTPLLLVNDVFCSFVMRPHWTTSYRLGLGGKTKDFLHPGKCKKYSTNTAHTLEYTRLLKMGQFSTTKSY